MQKVMKISGFYACKDKFENLQWQVDGISFEKYSKEYHGFPTKRVWIKREVFAFTDGDINKTLYVEYNDKGRIIQVETK